MFRSTNVEKHLTCVRDSNAAVKLYKHIYDKSFYTFSIVLLVDQILWKLLESFHIFFNFRISLCIKELCNVNKIQFVDFYDLPIFNDALKILLVSVD
jgi:hypothetical protein